MTPANTVPWAPRGRPPVVSRALWATAGLGLALTGWFDGRLRGAMVSWAAGVLVAILPLATGAAVLRYRASLWLRAARERA